MEPSRSLPGSQVPANRPPRFSKLSLPHLLQHYLLRELCPLSKNCAPPDSYLFLILALDGSDLISVMTRLCFTPWGMSPQYPPDRRQRVGPRASTDTEARRKIACPCQGLNPGHPVHIQTLY